MSKCESVVSERATELTSATQLEARRASERRRRWSGDKRAMEICFGAKKRRNKINNYFILFFFYSFYRRFGRGYSYVFPHFIYFILFILFFVFFVF